MWKLRSFLVTSGVAAAVLTSQRPALAVLTNTQLVYSFTYSANQNVSARDSSNPAQDYGAPDSKHGGYYPSTANGLSQYDGSLTDKGTMTVDIVREQSDGGLIVTISEQGENIRRAPPATCVVYGNTQVMCDPNKTVYTEEYTLLRFMGTSFVDPNQLDARKHWSITQSSAGLDVKADYTIDGNANGIMQIGEVRSVRDVGGGSLTTDIQAKIGYDYTRAIPTSVDEYVTQRHDNGVSGTTKTVYQTTLALVSDNAAKP
jgi:hypothetical protein